MTNYSERLLRLAAELRKQALSNPDHSKQSSSDRSRSGKSSSETFTRKK